MDEKPPIAPSALEPEDFYFDGPVHGLHGGLPSKRGYCCGSGAGIALMARAEVPNSYSARRTTARRAAPPDKGRPRVAGSRTSTAKRGNAKLPPASSITFNWHTYCTGLESRERHVHFDCHRIAALHIDLLRLHQRRLVHLGRSLDQFEAAEQVDAGLGAFGLIVRRLFARWIDRPRRADTCADPGGRRG